MNCGSCGKPVGRRRKFCNKVCFAESRKGINLSDATRRKISEAAKASRNGARLNMGRCGVGVRRPAPVDWTNVQRVYDTGVNQWGLVKRFGVSRSTLREAVRAGLLTVRPQWVELTPDQRWMRDRMCAYHTQAHSRCLVFVLTAEQFEALARSVCWYCGGGPVRAWSHSTEPRFNGLDRIDNSEGYIDGNVVACCGMCNKAKGTLSVGQFLALTKCISDRHHEYDSTNATAQRDIRRDGCDLVAAGDDIALQGSRRDSC